MGRLPNPRTLQHSGELNTYYLLTGAVGEVLDAGAGAEAGAVGGGTGAVGGAPGSAAAMAALICPIVVAAVWNAAALDVSWESTPAGIVAEFAEMAALKSASAVVNSV